MEIKTQEHIRKTSKRFKRTKKEKERIKQTWRKKYKDGYKNPTKNCKRKDLSEWNSKNIKGKTWEQRFGEEKAKLLKLRAKTRTLKFMKEGIFIPYVKYGKENGNWKGGLSQDGYPFEFNNELKYAIRLRDNFKCHICKEQEGKIPFSIHHIDYNKDNNDVSNLVCLCVSCHSKTNSRRSYWIEYFGRERKIEKEFVTYGELRDLILKVAVFLSNKNVSAIVPVKRGGVYPGVCLSYFFDIPIKDKPTCDTDVIVDEIVDFGLTFKTYKRNYPRNLFVCLHLNKRHYKLKIKPDYYAKEIDSFMVYPWETEWSKNG